MRITPVHAGLGLVVLLATAACGSSDDAAPTSGKGPIAVEASDTACKVERSEAVAGTIQFTVRNTGSKVNEFYVYGEGDQIIGEVENITPGLTRSFHVEVSTPGTYQTACKPGMKGKGIRADFTVTGGTASQAPDAAMAAAVTQYQTFVSAQSDELLTRTTEFVTLVKAGKVDEAKRAFPLARGPWERIEPVAESFGDLDPRIDGREDVVEEGMKFTGFHRLEKDLWVDGLQPDSDAIADQLLTDVKEIVAKAKAVELNPLQLANGSKALLDEVATGKITGEEDRYSHTDLYDFDENVKGSKAAIDALRPVLKTRDAALLADIDARFAALDAELDKHRTDDGFVLYTALSKDEVRALTVALDAVSEPISTVAGVVAAQ
ncbi:iron uptake system component EfeO [Pedococcus dokdonensis]|uniref:Iron uptake system component EfeO n=1 Tax=Pedococcus dokdonensis TaxID=443156 RepID=A0A1H0TQY5_9MICO|nr:iron uptake system protein EfeO [Pedococcus dokdonensis]SDP56414.1 iron uptake system component EfeO [Pedococcus dokdonensis]